MLKNLFFKWQFDVLRDPDDAAAMALKQAAFDRDSAIAAQKKLQKELDEMKAKLPTQDQLDRLAALEKQAEEDAEKKKREEGEFNLWRKQINEKHESEKKALQDQIATAGTKAATVEKELRDKLIGLEFSSAAGLFGGEKALTVLTPDIAQAYFGTYVEVVQDETSGERSVVVKDRTGARIVDPKTGQPMGFADAMKEIVEKHPQKDSILRGSGRVGSNSPGGGGNGNDPVDMNRLRAKDFADPKVRAAVGAQIANSGGVQIGTAFDRRPDK